MIISEQIRNSIQNSSWIRKMFEEGQLLIQKVGAENVYDLSLGNPTFEPPEIVHQVLTSLLKDPTSGQHRYMSNAGYLTTRQFFAEQLSQEHQLNFHADDIIMTVGAAGGLNVILKTICNPGDEVITFAPYFAEYTAYVANHGAILKPVNTTSAFQINFDLLEQSITSTTRAILINSPNNPTGVIYPAKDLKRLALLLQKKSAQLRHNIILIADEPYKKIVYDKIKIPSIFQFYQNSIIVTSSSKDLALPGERIGMIAISPLIEGRSLVQQGLVIALRTLGFVNAPALMQRMLPLVKNASLDTTAYQINRDLLFDHLTKIGFQCIQPQGAFYLFPKSPIPDDIAFVQKAKTMNLLLTPGSGFGYKGYFRIAFCFTTELIQKTLPIFTKLAQYYQS